MNYGMRCHDICPKGTMDEVFDAVKDHQNPSDPAGAWQIHFRI